jgi:hypothetical protein
MLRIFVSRLLENLSLIHFREMNTEPLEHFFFQRYLRLFSYMHTKCPLVQQAVPCPVAPM